MSEKPIIKFITESINTSPGGDAFPMLQNYCKSYGMSEDKIYLRIMSYYDTEETVILKVYFHNNGIWNDIELRQSFRQMVSVWNDNQCEFVEDSMLFELQDKYNYRLI